MVKRLFASPGAPGADLQARGRYSPADATWCGDGSAATLQSCEPFGEVRMRWTQDGEVPGPVSAAPLPSQRRLYLDSPGMRPFTSAATRDDRLQDAAAGRIHTIHRCP